MSYDSVKDIPLQSTWTKIEPLLKGWSEDKKFYIEDKNGDKFLLRLSDINLYEKKKTEFQNIKLTYNLGINMPKPIEFGICNDGNNVYSLFSWVEGEEAEEALPLLNKDKQYELGLEAGRILKKIHTIKPTVTLPGWKEFFQVHIDRVINAYENCGYIIENDKEIINFIRENEEYLAGRPMTFIHGDYHLGNMIITLDGNLSIIDFNRSGYGDPWKEYDRFIFTWGTSIEFANGQLHGYFNNNTPDEFFILMALYNARNLIASVPWSIPFGEKELEVAIANIDKVSRAYDGFKNYVPNWYKEK